MIIIEVELILLEGSVNCPAAYLDMHILLSLRFKPSPYSSTKNSKKGRFVFFNGLVDEALRCWSWL